LEFRRVLFRSCSMKIWRFRHTIFLCGFLLLFSFGSCISNDNSIKMKGSDTEVNLAVNLAEHYTPIDPAFSISISGGGSGLGITSLLNGQADIANSSRP